MNRFHLSLISLVSGILFAQPPPTATAVPTAVPSPSPPPHPARSFSVFVWPNEGILESSTQIKGLPRTFYRGPSGNTPVRLVRNSMTPLFPYTGPLPLELYDIHEKWVSPPPTAPEGTPPTLEQTPQVSIRANFPQNWTSVLLIVFPDKIASDGTLLTIPLPYDTEKLKPGMARIYNGGDRHLVLEFPDISTKELTLPPYSSFDFSPNQLSSRQNTRVFAYGKSARGDVELVHTSRLFFDNETSNYFFLYPQGPQRYRILRVAGHAENAAPLPTSPPSAP